MSGLEVPAALELTVQIIALVETIIKLWDTAKDARGLPKDMRAVADSLPLLRRTLTCAEEKLRADAGVEADRQDAGPGKDLSAGSAETEAAAAADR
ncbi:hypothetical protein LTR49_023174 [Elasticomyces elasticus]|nr:hypothetical protein LTR49_023174 [Elasticomyces elasticus]